MASFFVCVGLMVNADFTGISGTPLPVDVLGFGSGLLPLFEPIIADAGGDSGLFIPFMIIMSLWVCSMWVHKPVL